MSDIFTGPIYYRSVTFGTRSRPPEYDAEFLDQRYNFCSWLHEDTCSCVPFGESYRDGVSLAIGWLAGTLGGAQRIIVSQLADHGSVKIFSRGCALGGGPSMYLHNSLHHDHGAQFREIASFEPFGGSGGTRVATTSTTTGANLLVSGVGPEATDASVAKYDLARPNA